MWNSVTHLTRVRSGPDLVPVMGNTVHNFLSDIHHMDLQTDDLFYDTAAGV